MPASLSRRGLLRGRRLRAPPARRTTYGATPELVAEVKRLGPQTWLARQLAPETIDDSACDKVATPSSDVWSTKPWDDRHVIRPHALGRDAGYTQADVVSCARALTGLSVSFSWVEDVTPDQIGTYRYRPDYRYVGPVALLGWSHPNGDRNRGQEVAASLLRHLATHPATARRLARKLRVRFLSDDPPVALVDRLAAVYLASGTAIVPVLQALFDSPEFAASVGRKFRRPYEDHVATVRILGIQPSEAPLTRTFQDRCPDAWLAALALSHGASMATRDRGFARFPGLTLVSPH